MTKILENYIMWLSKLDKKEVKIWTKYIQNGLNCQVLTCIWIKLLYVNQLDSSSIVDDDKGLTSAMINNYVKNGHLDKPIKKKYNRKQLARLIVITCLKNVFSIQEISKTINSLTSEGNSEEMYDNFVMCMNGEKRDGLADVIVAACDTVRLYKKTHDLVEKLK